MLATNYIDIQNLWSEMIFNNPEQVDNGDGTFTTKYRPLLLRFHGQAITSDGGKKDVSADQTVGSLQANPMTAKQLYTAAGSASTLNLSVQAGMKALYLAAVNTDLSV